MSSYRSYVPWSKSNLSSSYTGSGSSYASNPKTPDNTTSKTTTTDQKYDSGYTGRRYGVPSASAGSSTGSSSYRSSYNPADRATTPSKYGSSTSSANSYLSNKDKDKLSSTTTATSTKDTKENDRPAMSIREKYNMGPALPSTTTLSPSKTKDTTDKPSTRDNYSSKDDRQSLIDKYSSGTYPSRSTDSSKSYSTLSGTADKKDDSPSGYTSRSLSRTSKTESNSEPDKTSSYNSLSPYSRYSRTSSPYSRTASKETESASSATSTPATTPTTTPSSLRFGTGTRYGGSVAPRSPVNDRPSVVGVTSPTPDKYRSRPLREEVVDVKVTRAPTSAEPVKPAEEKQEEKVVVETKMVAVVTRGTSPTPPSTSSFLRTRRDNLARIIEKTVERPVKKPEMADKEIQSDRGDDTARLSRFGSTSRSAASPWTSYLDRLNTSGSGYSPTVSKYSTKSYSTPSTRSEREATVTSTTASDNKASPATLVTEVKEESKEAGTKKPEKVTAIAAPDETVAKTNIKKSPSVKKVGDTSIKKAASAKNVDDSNLNKTANTPKTIEVVLGKNAEYSSTTDKICDTKPSITTNVHDKVDAKTATNDTPIKLVLKKSPSITKLNTADKNNSAKLPAVKPQKVTIDDTKPFKSFVTNEEIKREESSDPNKTASPSKSLKTSLQEKEELTVPLDAKEKDISSGVKEDMPDPSTTATKVGTIVPSKTLSQEPALKVKIVDQKKDVAILKGALAGLIRANTEKPATKRLSIDSQSESESENQKSKSSPSPPASSESDKMKSPPLSPSPTKTASIVKLNSPATNRKLLPPPVPKTDNQSSLKTSTSQNSLNKDFRKSTLNMGATNPTEAEELKKLQDEQRKVVVKKTKRSTSTSSDVSETSETSEAPDKRGRSIPAVETPVTNTTKTTTLLSSAAAVTAVTTSLPSTPPLPITTAATSTTSTTTSTSLSDSKLQTSSTANTGALQVPSLAQSPRPPAIRRESESSSSEADTSETTSSSSSDEEVEEGTPSRSSASNLPKTSVSSSLQDNNKSLLSPNSSKCIQSVSSADESSIADKPPRPPSSPKPPQKEEAKSFLMRALAPVTNLFKTKTPEPGVDSSNENISESLPRTESIQSLTKSSTSDKDEGKKSESDIKKKHKIRHIESGERAWWLESSDKIPDGVQRVKSSKSVAKLSSDSETESKKNYKLNKKHKIRHIESGERAWWLDSTSSIPEGIEKTRSNASLNKITETGSECDASKKHKIRHVESGERAWWMGSNSNIPEGIERIKSNASITKIVETNEGTVEEDKSIRKIRKQESGERAWWLDSSSNIPEGVQRIKSKSSVTSTKEPESKGKRFSIRHQESGEKAWWMNNSSTNIPGEAKTKCIPSVNGSNKGSNADKDNSSESSEEETTDSETGTNKNKNAFPKFPLDISVPSSTPSAQQAKEGDGRASPYDNVVGKKPTRVHRKRPKNLPLFISNHRNIDDILGTAATLVDPVMGMSRMKSGVRSSDEGSEEDKEDCKEVCAEQVRIHDSTAQKPTIQRLRDMTDEGKGSHAAHSSELDDTALQLYKDGDYGSYLDLEASISEQQEEFEGFQTNRKNSIVLRTQLSVRVHTIIEKLLNSEGRELRRALFSLKQIFQEDKDLVHEFVQNDGLACLIKVGSEADQNYQNYILRALGQVMLYVDGMNGVMEHARTVQWLYALVASKFRLVVKTALKLLLVFVEYVDTNCLLLVQAVTAVDSAQGLHPWSHVMRLVKDYDSADTELLIYATTLLNKTLNGVPDQDTYYDQVDALEEQGIEGAIQRYMSKQGTDLDLLRQFQIYEAVLHHEDGEEKGTPLKQLDETIRKTLRNRKSPAESLTLERRKSRRHSTGTSPFSPGGNTLPRNKHPSATLGGGEEEGETSSSSARSSPGPGEAPLLNGAYRDKQTGDAGVTPALRRRRERAERQRSFIREQQETSASLRATRCILQDGPDDENELNNSLSQRMNNGICDNKLTRVSSRQDVMTPLMNAVNKLDSADNECKSPDSNGVPKKPAWTRTFSNESEEPDGEDREGATERKILLQLKRESTVKDLTQKLASQNILNSPPVEDKVIRIGDMSGLISKAKEGLAKSKSKADVLKSTSGDIIKLVEKKSETELHWEELVSGMSRDLSVCDLDFTDLKSDDEVDVLSPAHVSNGIPPPPPPAPPSASKGGPPPPPPNRLGSFVPPPCPTTPTSFGVNLRHQRSASATSPEKPATLPLLTPSKTKKTVKLFWKEVRDDTIMSRQQKTAMIWDELGPVEVDTQKLEHLFESRAKDLVAKEKQQEMSKTKEIIVLDHKRSNAINIGMTKLPPPRSIKTAIMKMDATIMTREGIEKLLTMLPTEDEQSRIQEAQISNPEMPLGSAEQFLLTLASISELSARLKLWAFKLDYENSEKEIAEPLMDLKQGVETLRANKTFRRILSTLLSIGIFLNGTEVKGFQIEYLAKVPEVKDTVHKHSLLHHLCHMVMEKFPEATDLYSEIGAVTRASKVDFDELAANIGKMEQECKASWDHLKDIAKHDGSTIMKVKMTDFLADCAERIIVLGIVHRRVMNRYHKFLLWLGIPFFRVPDMKPNEFCRIVSEFALEYRTTRERVLQQLEKKANHRERNKTRGKMITEVGKFHTKEDRADAELRHLLGTAGPHQHGSDVSDVESALHGSLPWRRQRKDLGRTVLGPLHRGGEEGINGHLTDGDDEILESLVKTATKAPGTRTTPRERKRTRHADRKSLKRSRTRENNVGGEGSASP